MQKNCYSSFWIFSPKTTQFFTTDTITIFLLLIFFFIHTLLHLEHDRLPILCQWSLCIYLLAPFQWTKFLIFLNLKHKHYVFMIIFKNFNSCCISQIFLEPLNSHCYTTPAKYHCFAVRFMVLIRVSRSHGKAKNRGKSLSWQFSFYAHLEKYFGLFKSKNNPNWSSTISPI